MADFRTRGSEVLVGGAGLELVAFNVRLNVTAAPDRIRDGGTNLLASVTRSALGKILVKFNKPYPRQLVAAVGSVHKATGNNGVHVNILRDSYDNATGELTIDTIIDDNTNLVDDAADDDVLNFIGVFQTVNLLAQP